MVAGQVGEGGGGDRDAVEPELVEAVARRLDRDVLDAGRGQLGEIAMQRDRVGRRQRAGTAARAGATRPSVPRLAAGWPSAVQISRGEMRDRGLAVGAGDGGDRLRLPAVKARREQREAALRVGVGDDRDAAAASRRRASSAAASSVRIATAPLRHRLAGESAAVACCAPRSAANRKPGSHLARIGGKPGDLGIVETGSGQTAEPRPEAASAQ